MSEITNGTTVTLEANGALTTDGSVTQAADANLDNTTNNTGFPILRFAFSGAYASAPTAGTTVNLYRRILDQEGSASADGPEVSTTYLNHYLGSFKLNAVTTTQHLTLDAMPRHSDPDAKESYYIENNGGQSLSLGWTLSVTPYKIA